MLSISKSNILKAFSQRYCVLCGALSSGDLCKPCRSQLPQIPNNHCPVCLLPVKASLVCGACLADPPAYTRIIAALHYTFPVDALIRSLKYRSHLIIAPILANFLIEKINISDPPDFIIPVPLHVVRLRERGFNQTVEIGRYISKRHNIEMLSDSCLRVKNTPSQVGLPWQEREKNIRNAFVCSTDLSGKHVAILDDVMTSGATINEMAKLLRQQGAAAVEGWVVARALPATGIHFS